MKFSAFDEAAMRRALELAQRGLYSTHPNPRVGAVLARDEEIVGEGWHERAGEPHAEPIAIRAAGDRARGATAYVTLEPCGHHGRTPPCVDVLLAAGVRRVVYAVGDPNPRVNGAGAARLKEAGLKVQSGLLEADAEALNAGFLMRMRHRRPFIRLKTGASLDGKTALANGESQWITSEEARADVQHWRAQSGAVLTSAATVIADDPRLDVRIETPRQPMRVVLDRRRALRKSARVLAAPGDVLVFAAPTRERKAGPSDERLGNARVERIRVSRS
ncbi:MAG TPA: bifunctional diaminohydroxyphosphoribosylaminopyrimidine deaminase/5-amino-6-(5-phosphoribosylamino)uracil reductase RibD, partial [Steroidobacteraceae bacterium]|nr:bifunctional diaminohydroxyphosphoribosylaminopyrimidine deaminase/5-amino-6-(5-phosphoribosylamino)uracil reductase RibD [Steroidobacteraceae bacterium]